MVKLHQAILLVGGKGTRVKKVLGNTPKPLVLINKIPFLKYVIDKLLISGIKKFVLIVGPNRFYFENFLENYYSNLNCKLVCDYKQLGTANALFQSKCFLNDYFILLNGDSFLKFDFKHIIYFFNSLKKKKSFFVVNKVNDCSRYGRLLIHNNIVKNISEKKNSFPGFINSGIYVFKRKEIVKYLNFNSKSLEKECLPKLLKKNNIKVLRTNSEFIDIGTLETLKYSSIYFK